MSSVILSAEFSTLPYPRSLHYHDWHEIIYVTKGSANVQIGTHSTQVRAGSLILFSRFEQHSVTALSKDYERYVLQIDPVLSFCDQSSYKIFSILFNRPEKFRNILDLSSNGQKYAALFKRITQEKKSGAILCEDMLDLMMKELLIHIFRQYPEIFESFSQEQFETVRLIQAQFEDDCSRNYTLSQLARQYNISISCLSHQFKKITGSPVMGYLTSCRMALAKKYLVHTHLSIDEIVSRCGFSDASNFSRTFRQQTGFTPSQFRQQYR